MQQIGELISITETIKDERKLSPIQTAHVELTNLEGEKTIEQQEADQFIPKDNSENDPPVPHTVYQKQLGSDEQVFIGVQDILQPNPHSEESVDSGLKSPNHVSDHFSEIPSENMHSRPRSASIVIANAINPLSESRIADPG